MGADWGHQFFGQRRNGSHFQHSLREYPLAAERRDSQRWRDQLLLFLLPPNRSGGIDDRLPLQLQFRSGGGSVGL